AVACRHCRLTGTRDYSLPPEQCVAVEEDGVTLSVDLARSDLLLETELQRFAERLDATEVHGRRRYRLTPTSLAAGCNTGLGLRALEDWFVQRTGRSLSPACRLLVRGPEMPGPQLRRQCVLHVATEEIADGLCQWPGTRGLIQERLGPVTLTVAEEDVESLREQLRVIGASLRE